MRTVVGAASVKEGERMDSFLLTVVFESHSLSGMSQELTAGSAFDRCKKTSKNGAEYWMGRDIQSLLGYADWDNFVKVVEKAKISCGTSGASVNNHFRDTTEEVLIGSGAMGKRATYMLSRYACYLVAMNGNPSKPAIALAQTYFAVQTRRMEIQDQAESEPDRIGLRDHLTEATKGLNSAAKNSGVQKYGLFHDAGYRGLYGGMGLGNIKARKGLSPKDDLFDCAGRSELAANIFRATQAKERLQRERPKSETEANRIHHDAGKEVRQTIRKLGNTLPEDLPAEVPIKLLKKERQNKISASQTQPKLLG